MDKIDFVKGAVKPNQIYFTQIFWQKSWYNQSLYHGLIKVEWTNLKWLQNIAVTAFWRGFGGTVFYYIFNVSILTAVQTETEIIFPNSA